MGEETTQIEPPRCAICDGKMTLARVTPKLGGLPELRTFQCTDCKHVVTVSDNPLDEEP